MWGDGQIFRDALVQHNRTFGAVADLEPPFLDAVKVCRSALDAGGKLLFCGNGGSAADAQHAAAELTGRFRRERRALAAMALTTDSSALTAVGNDYGFNAIFSRQVEALGRRGDVLVVISTSGNSANVLSAAERAAEIGIATVALTGKDGGRLRPTLRYCPCRPGNGNGTDPRGAHLSAALSLCRHRGKPWLRCFDYSAVKPGDRVKQCSCRNGDPS